MNRTCTRDHNILEWNGVPFYDRANRDGLRAALRTNTDGFSTRDCHSAGRDDTVVA